jgi:nuclear pore complex protein Nup85
VSLSILYNVSSYIDLSAASALLFSSSGALLLLQKLEEIFTRTSQGAGPDYLAVLTRVLKGRSEKEALERLKTVRLALARYFARSLVLGAAEN